MTTTIGLGTSEDSKLALYTNSEKRLVIDNDGRVIIGSETFRGNKFDKLTIRDDTVQTDPATGDNVDTDVNIFTYAPLGVSRLFLSSKGTDAWIEGEGHGNGKHSLKFITEGSGGQLERVRIDGDGNVGIGTGSPGSKLEVAGAINTVDLVVTNSAKLPGGDIEIKNLPKTSIIASDPDAVTIMNRLESIVVDPMTGVLYTQ